MAMDLQHLSYFTEGNTFTGSRTKDEKAGLLLRYLVKPDKENDLLLAYCWREDLCFEKAKIAAQVDFPLTEEGLAQVQDWLTDQYESL